MSSFPDQAPAPSQPGITREELHSRRVEMRGFRRSDDLFEVKGRVVDRKPQDFVPASRGKTVPANDPIHDMGVRLAFDREMAIRDVQTFTQASPYGACPEGGRALQSLKGLRIGAGWGSEIRSRLGGAKSSTHLMELLMPLATTAIQSLVELRLSEPEPLDGAGRPRKIDSCLG